MYIRKFFELFIKIVRVMVFFYYFIFGVYYGGNMEVIVYNYNLV